MVLAEDGWTSSLLAGTARAADLQRVISPFGWARFTTNGGVREAAAGSAHAGALAALYGSLKEWQSQWVDMSDGVNGFGLEADLGKLAAAAGSNVSWKGVSWPTYGSLPVVLLPAADSLEGDGSLPCAAAELPTNASCRAAAQGLYAQQVVAYMGSLSSNVTVQVMPGGRWYPLQAADSTAAALLTHFVNC